MSADESAIRDLMDAWFEATGKGDLNRLLTLMAEDVVFLTAGRPPFGRDAFVASFNAGLRQHQITCTGEMEEIAIVGDLAYTRGRLAVCVTPRVGSGIVRLAGHTLSIFRKQRDGRWLLARDANLLNPF
jgi:uncharacterized protein (TIGR02246 family)